MISIQFPIKRQTNRTAKQTKKPETLQLSLPASAAFQPCGPQHTDTSWEQGGVPVPPHPSPKLQAGAGSDPHPCTQGMSHVCHSCEHPLSSWHSCAPCWRLPLMPLSIFIRRLMMVSLLSPCLMSIFVEKWPLQGWGFTRNTDTPG